MSACISPRGEFSDHVFGTEGDDRFVCSRCWTFAEDAVLSALSAAEARVETLQRQVEAIYSRRIEQLAANEQAAAELQADIDRCDATGVWDAAGNPGTRARAIDRERDYLHAALGDLRQILAVAAVPGKPQPTQSTEES